ncbi:restriction endonuclease subunit S [Pseudorhodobacter turbinis]|uniref:Restriction endonuclease subunit S n=1 Tax=Pseudorhodobacter turbinis TaxID=2500533 RepID=A0A4V1E0Y9_9RHOB|nr:restriction endonuclease subunit S [Pseudorhodobacter turbinis]QCO56294.1 restriction endonuclease subunit S [Pseudorhodobacter turbinis]
MNAAVPKLRFDGFDGAWTNERISNGVTLISGQHLGPDDYTTYQSGTPYFTGPSDFTNDERALTKWTQAKAKIALRGDVLITVKGSGVGELMLLELPEVAMGRQLMAIRSGAFAADLLSHVLQGRRNKFQALAAGNMIPGLSRDDILTMKVSLPCAAEQQKIAAFLGAVDSKLSALRRKQAGLERFKAGLMQRLFSQKLRFTQDDGSAFPDWEETAFEDVVFAISTRGHQILATAIQENGRHPVLDQGKQFIAGYSDETERLLKNKGAIIFGDHTTELKCSDFDFIVGADGVKVLRTNENIRFMYYAILSNLPKQEGYKRHFSILRQSQLPVPHPDEQRKIADALTALDTKITATAAQITKIELFKQGLLQQMFV